MGEKNANNGVTSNRFSKGAFGTSDFYSTNTVFIGFYDYGFSDRDPLDGPIMTDK